MCVPGAQLKPDQPDSQPSCNTSWGTLIYLVAASFVQRRRFAAQVCQTMGLKFVGTDAFDDFYQLQQLKRDGKVHTAAELTLSPIHP